MDIEFHFYATYLIAMRAGFSHADAAILAHASQGVDDNHVPVQVNEGDLTEFKNTISQTMDILHPHDDKHIYPVFHFVPGDPNAPSAARVDRKTDPMVATPDGPIALASIKAALASGDLYRIGVASHVYMDTWAHQNFTGRKDDFNMLPIEGHGENEALQGIVDLAINVGHGAAKHSPDIPALIWTDARLIESTVNNRDRFLDASEALFRRFAESKGKAPAEIDTNVAELRTDLAEDIGEPSTSAMAGDQLRIDRYCARALTSAYGGQAIPPYHAEAWFEDVLEEDRKSIVDRFKAEVDKLANKFGDYSDLIRQDLRIDCSWKDAGSYASTNWYRFQSAVKKHYEETWAALLAAGLEDELA
jgi:hypothetical protein